MALQSASNAPPPREVLILEPDAEGHSQEWLQHLAEYVAAAPTSDSFSPSIFSACLSRWGCTPRESRSVEYCSGRRCTTAPLAATGPVPARNCGISARICSTG